jgi:uncharacterized protein
MKITKRYTHGSRDSDIAKWVEGACYCLAEGSDAAIEDAISELIQMMKSAQQEDGYLNLHYQLVEPGKRFTNLRDMHELYNCGHLIEAALAHEALVHNNEFLSIMTKYVDLLHTTFGPGQDQMRGYPGHPEIELALLRLHQRTQNPKHLELASYFVNERGNPRGDNGKHYYTAERERRGEISALRPRCYPEPESNWYNQAHLPIAEMDSVEGHSVRAMYLLTAVADLVRMEGSSNTGLKDALYRLWNNMVDKKMYLTGGIGAMKQWEGFGIDHFLPQGTDDGGCYSETCASIGVMMLAERILQFDLDRRYSDIMELCLLNAVLTSMSHDGIKFTYVNQLASSDADLSKREEWFTCACCPPNVLRTLGMIGGYVYSQPLEKPQINVHLYVPSTHKVQIGGKEVVLTQKSNWPWEGKIDFTLESVSPDLSLALRIPGWASKWKVTPPPASPEMSHGYLHLTSEYLKSNPSFVLEIDIKTRLVSPHPLTNQDSLTLMRGPIVYCVEDVDNTWVKDHFRSVQLSSSCQITESTVTDKENGDTYVALKVGGGGASLIDLSTVGHGPGLAVEDIDRIEKAEVKELEELNFVPYYFRANRGGKGMMRVGLRRWHKD